jgi:hypothetical protein
MSTTMTRPPTSASPNGRGHAPASAGRNRERRHGRIAAGVLIIVVCVLGTVTLYSNSTQRVTVLSVRRWVAPGARIAAGDLSTTTISAETQVRTIAATAQAQTIGRIAAVGLVPGTLLAPEQVRDGPQVPTGMAIAGATLKPGQYPVGLDTGDEVEVVETPSASASTAEDPEPRERGRARVLAMDATDDSTGSLQVSLIVARDVATTIAAAGAAGNLSLVVIGRR